MTQRLIVGVDRVRVGASRGGVGRPRVRDARRPTRAHRRVGGPDRDHGLRIRARGDARRDDQGAPGGHRGTPGNRRQGSPSCRARRPASRRVRWKVKPPTSSCTRRRTRPCSSSAREAEAGSVNCCSDSVSQQCAHYAACPVVIVRANRPRQLRREDDGAGVRVNTTSTAGSAVDVGPAMASAPCAGRTLRRDTDTRGSGSRGHNPRGSRHGYRSAISHDLVGGQPDEHGGADARRGEADRLTDRQLVERGDRATWYGRRTARPPVDGDDGPVGPVPVVLGCGPAASVSTAGPENALDAVAMTSVSPPTAAPRRNWRRST